MLRKCGLSILASGLLSSFFITVAQATPVDLTSLTDAVDFTTVTAAILAVAALLMVVYIAWKAAKMVIRAVKGL